MSAGEAHSLALRGDGNIVTWGSDSTGQLVVPELPVGVTYTAVAAGEAHSLALRSDGSVVAFGANAAGQTDVPALPAGSSYAGVETVGPASVFYFNQSLVHTTISGNAVVSIPTTATSTFSLQVRGSGTVGYQTDNGDSFTATIINIGP